jgi:endonuclease/exonuclease/phosphatase family metal-dependent hydrolase
MVASRLIPTILFRAPALAGAAFCALILLALPSCGEDRRSPDWENAAPAEAPAAENPAAAEPPAAGQDGSAHETAEASPSARPSASGGPGLRFVAYNVENWLIMDREVNRRDGKDAPKPETEKRAVIKILAKHRPDVVGLCEIGGQGDLDEIRQRLKASGIDLPHAHLTSGSDEVRRLGLLSRFPITHTAKPAETDFRIHGRTFSINRGILDASIQARGKTYRFIGVHLKSKRDSEDADQETLRVGEARLLRRHVDAILGADPNARLVVYGDFNDTRQSRTFKTVTGNYNSPGYLTPVPCRDSRGHAWTHHWRPQDVYSRIDFVTVSRPLRREVDFKTSYLADDSNWDDASDHRPLVVIFR